jgi:hypothetical protein
MEQLLQLWLKMGMFAMWSHLASVCCLVSFIFLLPGWSYQNAQVHYEVSQKWKSVRQKRIFIADRVDACCSKSFESHGEVGLEVQTSKLTDHPWNCKAVKANTTDCMTLLSGWHNRCFIIRCATGQCVM